MEKTNVTLDELKKIESTSEKLAREIRMLSRAFKKIADSGLKEEAIVILTHEYSGVGKPDIRQVIKALKNLESEYLEKEEQHK